MIFKKNRQSQIKFGETIGVIIIIYFILIIGLNWYNSVNKSNLDEIYYSNYENRAYESFQFIYNLNLLHKSQYGDINEEFDYISLKTMENYSKSKIGFNFFEKRLGFAIITLDIYNKSTFNSPSSTNMQETLTLFNHTPNSNFLRYHKLKTNIIYRTLIPIRNEIKHENLIGLLKIKTSVFYR